MHINISSLSYNCHKATIINQLSLTIPHGAKVGLLGPNGSGKTTLLKLLAGLVKPTAGTITLKQKPLIQYSRRQLASQVGLMMQHAPEFLELTVEQVVALGRLAEKSHSDLQQVLAQNSLLSLQHRSYNQLSGGQRQRVMFAQLQYQNPQLMLLDEPANHLDIKHSWQLLSQLRRQENTIIASYHCFNLAAEFCDHLILMQQGKVLVSGSVEEVLTPYWIKQAYGVDVEVLRSPKGALIVCMSGKDNEFITTN